MLINNDVVFDKCYFIYFCFNCESPDKKPSSSHKLCKLDHST